MLFFPDPVDQVIHAQRCRIMAGKAVQNIIFKTLQVGLEKRTVFRIEVVILKIKESSVRQPDGSLSHLFQITHLPFRFCSPEMPHNRFVNRL